MLMLRVDIRRIQVIKQTRLKTVMDKQMLFNLSTSVSEISDKQQKNSEFEKLTLHMALTKMAT